MDGGGKRGGAVEGLGGETGEETEVWILKK